MHFHYKCVIIIIIIIIIIVIIIIIKCVLAVGGEKTTGFASLRYLSSEESVSARGNHSVG